MHRPVWLFSLDTDQFCAPPMTTGALLAYFVRHGLTSAHTQVELVHFGGEGHGHAWLTERLPAAASRARAASASGREPVFGFSCYTWNVAEFLELARAIKELVPDALVVAGGPHVQRAEDFLCDEAIDVIVLGEGEITFTELLDSRHRAAWRSIPGLAFLDECGRVHRTAPRTRQVELDRFPSALDVIELRDPTGRPRYRQVAYETSRGCPYRCSFCEWGTGAIGTKMFQFGLSRIRADLKQLIAGGIQDVWLCDSNFGALREDRAKAEIVVELRERTGQPQTFATSWSKNHNARVQEIVRLLHRNGLLWHYHLALQTLTPKALELSHRTNMRANDYEQVARSLAREGVPIAAELIWGLPGDNLPDFARNLDHLMALFPNINIFGYTLLPGTEFFERRDEYRLETLPVAGYGKAKGEYVVGCHTFARDDGEEGYFLITSYVLLARGHVMPLTVRHLALVGDVAVSRLLCAVLRAVLDELRDELPAGLAGDRMAVYESRAQIYLRCLEHRGRTFTAIRRRVAEWLAAEGHAGLIEETLAVLELDHVFCPRTGPRRREEHTLNFAADRVAEALGAMERPDPGWFLADPKVLDVDHPGLVGDVLQDPDGGSWMRGRLVAVHPRVAAQGARAEDAAQHASAAGGES